MRHYFAIPSFMLISLFSLGQDAKTSSGNNEDSCDVIIRSDSSILYVKITDVLTTRIHYKDCGNPGGTGSWIRTKDVISYRYSNSAEFITPWERWHDTVSSRYELGISYNNFNSGSQYSYENFAYGLEFRYKLNESDKRKHYAAIQLLYNGSYNKTDYFSNQFNASNFFIFLGYRAEWKNSIRWKFCYGVNSALLISHYHTVPFDSSSASYKSNEVFNRTNLEVGLSPYIAVQLYIAQRCFIQLQTDVIFTFYNYNSIWGSDWWDMSFGSLQLPSIGVYVRL